MGKQQKISVVTDSFYQLHNGGGGEHPEIYARIEEISSLLSTGHLSRQIKFVKPRAASRAELMSFHPEEWLFRFEEAALSGRTYIDHPDNQISYESYSVALVSAGGCLTGIDQVEAEPERIVFCAVRPPGHHAEPTRPYGFCFFNNCVIAARYWQRVYGRTRLCIFDFDAHHGNGIQSGCEEDPDLLYISVHEHPSFSYPGTGWENELGSGSGKGTILNIPLPPGAGDDRILHAMDGDVEKLLDSFKPDGIIIGAGFDGHLLDDMSGLRYSTEGYYEIGRRIANWSRSFCSGRLVSILEGGYHPGILGKCVEAYLKGLLNR
jgi:acetoin utilization deacetylase AcuC-like enzyme